MITKEKSVLFRLLAKQTVTTADGEKEEVTYSTYRIPATYFTRDSSKRATQKVIHQFTNVDEKGVVRPVEEDQVFTSGMLLLYEGKDDHIISALRESVNNIKFTHRDDSDEAVFEEVNVAQERLSQVDKNELIFNAYTLIKESESADIVEYAKALGVDTSDFETATVTSKSKDHKKLKEYELVEKELKHIAANDPNTFIQKFSDPLRGFLATVKSGLALNVISYSSVTGEYSWVMGTNKQMITTLAKGVANPELTFASWLKDNPPTYKELKSRVDAASKV